MIRLLHYLNHADWTPVWVRAWALRRLAIHYRVPKKRIDRESDPDAITAKLPIKRDE